TRPAAASALESADPRLPAFSGARRPLPQIAALRQAEQAWRIAAGGVASGLSRLRGGAIPGIVRHPLAPTESGGGISLASIVPLILILMTITGAVYPALDLTAGQRERGTLEILLPPPVPRPGLPFGN